MKKYRKFFMRWKYIRLVEKILRNISDQEPCTWLAHCFLRKKIV
ncbi:hypothetical protein HMPREF1148_1594 [Selenomonas sp. FOBRC6]|nr:hypothetical protein HMPREF1148_1594 [Selenomonas sp. FOBRC6]